MSDAFLIVAFLIGYLFGSIPFGMVLTKLAGTQDLRSIGSGNIGATNVLRTGRKGLAAATLIGDMLKGTIAVMIAGYYGGANAAMLAYRIRIENQALAWARLAEHPTQTGVDGKEEQVMVA